MAASAPFPPSPPGGWSPPSTTCPPGLEYLMGLDHLFLNQKIEFASEMFAWGRRNYNVVNLRGESLCHISESSSLCSRLCFGRKRRCKFQVYDQAHREVLRMIRPLTCADCCCPCCLQELRVYAGETLCGSVVQEWNPWRPSFQVRDASDESVLVIKGPCIQPLVVHVPFQIKSVDGQHKVGIISKTWGGIFREAFTDSDKFGINFPPDLDVRIKAVLLGASLLIDLTYFD